jgi:hypothetical protein
MVGKKVFWLALLLLSAAALYLLATVSPRRHKII